MASTSLSATTTVVATEDALSTTIDDETVILHESSGKYYGLNDVGTFVWDLLEEPRTVGATCEAVTAEYDVAYERCEADVTEMVAELAEKGLVRLEDS
jgi:phage protein U